MNKFFFLLLLAISACGLRNKDCDDQIISASLDTDKVLDMEQVDISKANFVCSEKTRLDPSKTLTRKSYLTPSDKWLFDCKLNTYCQKYQPNLLDEHYCWPYYDGQDWNKDDRNARPFDEQLVKIYSGAVYRSFRVQYFLTKGSVYGDSSSYVYSPYAYGDKIYEIGDILYKF